MESQTTSSRGAPVPGAARSARSGLALVAGLALVTGPAVAQSTGGSEDRPRPAVSWAADDEGIRWFPDTTAFAPLLAAPRESGLRGSFVVADRPDLDDLTDGDGEGADGAGPQPPGGLMGDFPEANIEAEVALGLRLPVAVFQREGPGRPSISLEFEAGIFSRFFMESAQKDLINVDFRVGAPLSIGYRGWEARLELRHMSSHLGDDFAHRFGADLARQFSEEGFQLLVARRLVARRLRVYLGGEANFGVSSTQDVARTAASGGLEYDPGAVDGDRDVWPFAAFHLRVDRLTDQVAGTGVAGVGLRAGSVGLRLETRGHFGPSPMGRLREWDETFWGLGLRIGPTGAYR